MSGNADANRGRLTARDVRRHETTFGTSTFAARCIDLFGHRDMSALQMAFERGHTAIEDWLAGRKVPRDVHLILELLESTPKKHWPERWAGICDSPLKRG